jgi:transposase
MAPTGGAGLICLAWEEAGVRRSDGQRVRAIPQPEKGMTLTMVETCAVTGGVDTHADAHVAAALDGIGGLLGVREFPVSPAGYARLLDWLRGFGTVCLVGIEGTGSYGAGLARHMAAAGVRVVEVDRSDRQDRRRQGKSDPLDAVSAARAALSGRASGAPRGRDGQVEAIRVLMVAKRTARAERTQTINQARSLIVTGPDGLRARFSQLTPAGLVAQLAALRPRPGSMVRYHTLLSLRELGRRAEFLDGQIDRLDELIVPLVTARAPGLLALYGAGPDTAAILLIAAGDHPSRLRSEAAWAHLCGTAPIPASSGRVARHRLNPGGDRQANHALWRIVITRMGSHPATRAYVERRAAEGLSKPEIIRCLKRYAARETYRHLRPAGG